MNQMLHIYEMMWEREGLNTQLGVGVGEFCFLFFWVGVVFQLRYIDSGRCILVDVQICVYGKLG
jgi:hypothetical protein